MQPCDDINLSNEALMSKDELLALIGRLKRTVDRIIATCDSTNYRGDECKQIQVIRNIAVTGEKRNGNKTCIGRAEYRYR